MKCRDKCIRYCQEHWQSYLSAPQLLSNQKIESVYKKLLRNQSRVGMLKTGRQLFRIFSICILSWLLYVLCVFIFPSVYGYNLMPPSSLGWWNGQQRLLANEMCFPVLQLHQGAISSSFLTLPLIELLPCWSDHTALRSRSRNSSILIMNLHVLFIPTSSKT